MGRPQVSSGLSLLGSVKVVRDHVLYLSQSSGSGVKGASSRHHLDSSWILCEDFEITFRG